MSETTKTLGPYPGLGLPLRHWPQSNRTDWRELHLTYPHGAHPEIWGATSNLLPIREVAMMDIMERLTDKKDWHRKVFDDVIVEKWREEAMAIPDEQFVEAAAAPASDWSRERIKTQYVSRVLRVKEPTKIKGVMSKDAFDYVGVLFI